MNLNPNIKQICLNLMSVHEDIRKTGINNLQTYQATSELPPQISYALFYYFWHSDGWRNQQTDIQTISTIINPKDPKILKTPLFFSFLTSLVKEWSKVDYHRKNKFLLLIRELFKNYYSNALEKHLSLLVDINNFLVENVFFKPSSVEIVYEFSHCFADFAKILKTKGSKWIFLGIKPLLDFIAFHHDS